MTTIATDGRTLAADSMISSGGQIVGYHDKVHRAPDGRLFACCGPSTDARKFTRWMCEGGDAPKLTDDFSALVLTPEGKAHFICSALEFVEYLVPQAMGSGGEIALGALLSGKTPREAVEIAAMRDKGTGGEITELSL